MTESSDNVVRVEVENIGQNTRILHDASGRMVQVPPNASAVLLVPRRQYNDLRASNQISVRVTDKELTGNRAQPVKKKPAPAPKEPENPVVAETAASLLARVQSDDISYRDFVEAARATLGDEFPASPAQPKKRQLIALLEKRAEAEKE